MDPVVVGKAFNNLEYIKLKPNASMTTAQTKEILKQMAIETNVVNLKFDYDIFWLNPDLVARAVVQVEQVDMMCKMSRAHIMAILGQIDADSKIKELYLGRNDVSAADKSTGMQNKITMTVFTIKIGFSLITLVSISYWRLFEVMGPMSILLKFFASSLMVCRNLF